MTTTVGPGQFALLLQQYRAAGGVSQEQLPAQAGLGRSGVSALERGRRQLPQAASVRRLADGLGLTASEQRTASNIYYDGISGYWIPWEVLSFGTSFLVHSHLRPAQRELANAIVHR